jgi:hypothetical protein
MLVHRENVFRLIHSVKIIVQTEVAHLVIKDILLIVVYVAYRLHQILFALILLKMGHA